MWGGLTANGGGLQWYGGGRTGVPYFSFKVQPKKLGEWPKLQLFSNL